MLVDLGVRWGRPVRLLAQDPAPPPGKGPEFGKASPLGLVVLVLLCVAMILLVRSMNKQLRKVPASFDRRRHPTPRRRAAADAPAASDAPQAVDELGDAPAAAADGGPDRRSSDRLGPCRTASPARPALPAQHADNPVDWWAWSDDGVRRGRARATCPVLLSVGYAACHWCHVMAHESFEDAGDRRADQRRLRRDQGRPRGAARRRRRLHGGHPGDDRPGRLADDLLPHPGRASRSTAARTTRPRAASGRAARRRHRRPGATTARECAARPGRSPRRLAETPPRPLPPAGRRRRRRSTPPSQALAGEFDAVNGGFGGAPKFPPSMVLEFLLRHHERTGSGQALAMARRRRCEAMARGGMYDQLARRVRPLQRRRAAGSCRTSRRCSTTTRCCCGSTRTSPGSPARALARAGGRGDRRRSCCGTCARAEGGFASALDADTDGVEGLTYAWTPGAAARGARRRGRRLGRGAARGDRRRARSSTARRRCSCRRDPDDPARWRRDAGRAARRARTGARSPPATTRWSRPGTGWPSLALAEAGAALGRPEWVAAADARPRTCCWSGTSWTAGCAAPRATASSGPRPACWRTTPSSPRRCSRCTRPPARRAG